MNVDEFIKDWLSQKNIIINQVYEIPHHLLKTMLLEFYKLKRQEDWNNDSGSKEVPE